MGYFPVRYDSRVIIYDRKMFIRLATGVVGFYQPDNFYAVWSAHTARTIMDHGSYIWMVIPNSKKIFL